MKIKTVRYMYSDKVRKLCIDRGYCTGCDNEQYGHLLNNCTKEVDDNDVLSIAEKIYEYSDIENAMLSTGLSEAELLESICWGLFNYCTATNVKIER